MKKLAFNGFYFCALGFSVVAVILEKWPLAIWLALLLVLVTLDQIHDTLKAATPEKGQP